MTRPAYLRAYVVAAILLLYGSVAFVVLEGGEGSFAKLAFILAAWNASPLVIPLLVLIFARRRHTKIAAASILALVFMMEAALLVWGVVIDPGDSNHLVVIFAPVYAFIFVSAAFLLLSVSALVRRFRHPSQSLE